MRAHTHARTRRVANHPQPNKRARAHTQAHSRSRACARTHARTHAQLSPISIVPHARRRRQTHSLAGSQVHTHTHTHTHANAHAQAHAHTHARTHARAHTGVDGRMLCACMGASVCGYARECAHTLAQDSPIRIVPHTDTRTDECTRSLAAGYALTCAHADAYTDMRTPHARTFPLTRARPHARTFPLTRADGSRCGVKASAVRPQEHAAL